MAVRGKFLLQDAGKMEATLSLTMTVDEWVRVREQMVNSYPSWQVSNLIDQLVSKARGSWMAEGGDAP